MPTRAKTGNYTHPELREHLKQEIKAGDNGGPPGQWSARKSQLLVQEYEQRGGGYHTETPAQANAAIERKRRG